MSNNLRNHSWLLWLLMIFSFLSGQQQTDKEFYHFNLLTTLQHWPTVYNSNITKDLHSYNTALLSEQGPVLEKQFCKWHKQREVGISHLYKAKLSRELTKIKNKIGYN